MTLWKVAVGVCVAWVVDIVVWAASGANECSECTTVQRGSTAGLLVLGALAVILMGAAALRRRS